MWRNCTRAATAVAAITKKVATEASVLQNSSDIRILFLVKRVAHDRRMSRNDTKLSDGLYGKGAGLGFLSSEGSLETHPRSSDAEPTSA
jgi:hypothetical protein